MSTSIDGRKLEYFDGDEAVAAEYSEVKGCTQTDSGYHCSCYDHGECCMCGESPKKEEKDVQTQETSS